MEEGVSVWLKSFQGWRTSLAHCYSSSLIAMTANPLCLTAVHLSNVGDLYSVCFPAGVPLNDTGAKLRSHQLEEV